MLTYDPQLTAKYTNEIVYKTHICNKQVSICMSLTCWLLEHRQNVDFQFFKQTLYCVLYTIYSQIIALYTRLSGNMYHVTHQFIRKT